MLLMNMLICLIILKYVSNPKDPSFDVSDEYQKQLKSYRSIVRSNEKIIRELKKKEEQNNEKNVEQKTREETTSMVYPEEQHRIY